METNYLFTNDFDYLEHYTSLCNKEDIKSRIDKYFRLVVRNLRDSIPKAIGNFLVKEIENNMERELNYKIYNSKEIINSLVEHERIIQRRKELTDIMIIMKNAQNIIRNSPDLVNDLS